MGVSEMEVSRIKQWISKGEGHHLEFKLERESNEDFAKVVIAFANTDGGKILVGVDDSGEMIGVSDVDEVMRRLDDVAINRCEPPITIFQESIRIDDKVIVVVDVEKGGQRPYRTKSGQYYVRALSRCRQATREELLRIFQSTRSLLCFEKPKHLQHACKNENGY